MEKAIPSDCKNSCEETEDEFANNNIKDASINTNDNEHSEHTNKASVELVPFNQLVYKKKLLTRSVHNIDSG